MSADSMRGRGPVPPALDVDRQGLADVHQGEPGPSHCGVYADKQWPLHAPTAPGPLQDFRRDMPVLTKVSTGNPIAAILRSAPPAPPQPRADFAFGSSLVLRDPSGHVPVGIMSFPAAPLPFATHPASEPRPSPPSSSPLQPVPLATLDTNTASASSSTWRREPSPSASYTLTSVLRPRCAQGVPRRSPPFVDLTAACSALAPPPALQPARSVHTVHTQTLLSRVPAASAAWAVGTLDCVAPRGSPAPKTSPSDVDLSARLASSFLREALPEALPASPSWSSDTLLVLPAPAPFGEVAPEADPVTVSAAPSASCTSARVSWHGPLAQAQAEAPADPQHRDVQPTPPALALAPAPRPQSPCPRPQPQVASVRPLSPATTPCSEASRTTDSEETVVVVEPDDQVHTHSCAKSSLVHMAGRPPGG